MQPQVLTDHVCRSLTNLQVLTLDGTHLCGAVSVPGALPQSVLACCTSTVSLWPAMQPLGILACSQQEFEVYAAV